jgi:hypothetical protein
VSVPPALSSLFLNHLFPFSHFSAAMPFDPSLPVNNSQVRASELRGQFNGLKDLIDALQTVTTAQVDGVTTVEPGQPAGVTVSVVGDTLHFSFEIPRGNNGSDGTDGSSGSNGNDGPPGPPGIPGNDGAQGQTGPEGPPFAYATVSGVTTLDPGQAATVDAVFDGVMVQLSFGLPRGADGINGTDGAPGEVTAQQLLEAVDLTSSNSNAVSTLDNGYSDGEAEELRQKVNELIVALRR